MSRFDHNQVEKQPVFGRTRHIHMVGIGGIGMSGMAEILLLRGYHVSGSDKSRNEQTERLETLGAVIYEGHRAEQVKGADVVVYTSAVTASENVETAEALRLKIPTIKRSEMLAELMRMKFGIGVAGTHGKTTTTTMAGHVLQAGGLDPTIMVGGRVHSFQKTNAVVGGGDIMLVEADEYDRTFLKLSPSMVVITNLEAEHLDIYEDLEDLKGAFTAFANKVPFYGAVILCLDDPNIRSILPTITRRVISYGLNPHARVRALNIAYEHFQTRFDVEFDGRTLGFVEMQGPGEHNVKNALAAIALGLELQIPFRKIADGLGAFRGVFRRFQRKLEDRRYLVIDDYAHHPTEVRSTLNSIKTGWPGRRVVAVFQPHLYSRTKEMYQEFGQSFADAEVLVVLDVYPSREAPVEGVSGRLIADAAESYGHGEVHYVEGKEDLPVELMRIVKAGDIVITMGAGDVYRYGEAFVTMLREAGVAEDFSEGEGTEEHSLHAAKDEADTK